MFFYQKSENTFVKKVSAIGVVEFVMPNLFLQQHFLPALHNQGCYA